MGFPHPSSRTAVTLYNALAGDYNRLRDERAAPAFSATLFSPFRLERAHTAQPSYVFREGLERLKSEPVFIERRILTLDRMINNAVIIQEGSGSGDTVEVENTHCR